MPPDPTQLMITGVYRSGTTYAERLLDNLPDGRIASQPFPFLYVAAKRRFLRALGAGDATYPMGTGFLDPGSRPGELATFLESEQFSVGDIRSAWQAMDGYSGAMTPQMADVVGTLRAGSLAEIVSTMHERLAEARGGSESAVIVGSKEILVEEFAPTLGAAGVKTLVVVRDPRRVVASAQGPDSRRWTGAVRPILHTVRMWRKSAAYACVGGEAVTMVRLEDLSADPSSTLTAALAALDVPTVARLPAQLRSVTGEHWTMNSSYTNGLPAVDRDFALTPEQLAYVEALTRPEMAVLGYEPMTDAATGLRAVEQFTADDDPGRDHPAFAPGFSADATEIAHELERLDRLRPGPAGEDDARWFVLPGMRSRLAAAAATGRG